MIVQARRRTMAWCVAAPLTGCAGFRGGWESVAYIGDTPPADLKGPSSPFELPGVSLRVTINNRLRTGDTQVMLYVVPMSIDPRDVYAQSPVPGRTRVFLDTTPRASGWLFRPRAAVLSFGGARHGADTGHEFAQWDNDGQRVDRGGHYDHHPVVGERALADVGRPYLLSMDFPVSVPDPRSRDIVLDIAQCLVAASRPALPLIRFAPGRWEEGYT
jgi:hypothetical protein